MPAKKSSLCGGFWRRTSAPIANNTTPTFCVGAGLRQPRRVSRMERFWASAPLPPTHSRIGSGVRASVARVAANGSGSHYLNGPEQDMPCRPSAGDPPDRLSHASNSFWRFGVECGARGYTIPGYHRPVAGADGWHTATVDNTSSIITGASLRFALCPSV